MQVHEAGNMMQSVQRRSLAPWGEAFSRRRFIACWLPVCSCSTPAKRK